MNILVTGGAGYIGSKIALDLISHKHKVIIVDKLLYRSKKLIPKGSIFFKTDISDKAKIKSKIEKFKIDTVFHFAGLISVEESMKKPNKYFYNNYYKSKILIKICLEQKIKNFIYSSTAGVYSSPKKNIKIKENFKKIPNHVYGKSKLKVEKYIQKNSKKMNFVILRYFNVVGADRKLRVGQIGKGSGLFKKLSYSILKNKIFHIYGNDYKTKDGSPVRDFIHLEDLSDIHLRIMRYLSKKKRIALITLNCGYGMGYSVYHIVSLAKKKYKLRYKFSHKRFGDLGYIVADNNKLKKMFKWRPKFNSLEKMIYSTIKWEKKL